MKEITITLDTSHYAAPTESDIKAAKQYIIHRNEAANALQDVISDLLRDAAVKIVKIAYKYNFPGEVFTINASMEQLKEISAVMDELEQQIMEHLEEMILNSLEEEENSHGAAWTPSRRAALLTFMLALGHRNQNLRTTLYNYEWRFLHDIEAAIAALKLVGTKEPEAITKVRSHINSIYVMSEVQAAIKHPNNVMATFLRSQGVPHNPDGSPNLQGVPREGYNAIINSIRITNDIVWGRNQLLDFIERRSVGYYQLRGSSYPCDLCDSEVGFHLGLIDAEPLPHPHCMCYRIPIFEIP